jgi:ppGpp synthetase/RelA/SpoT-type nucleotidyltranferase
MDFDAYEREGRHAYAALAETVAAIIEKVAEDQSGYRIQQVQYRAKGVASLRKKLADRNVAESTQIEREIKDLAGVRVVLYTNADVARFISSGVIGDNFEIDWDRTKFHYPMKEPSAEEGFISYNYVVQLKADRTALPEYAAFAGLSCEVQVQTTLDHAWSEMAHDTIYKPPPPGFGAAAMKSVADRMTAIMQKYLRPAGFEFQKVVADARALEQARAIAEQDPLRRIAEAGDNNERHARIEEFAKTLAYYDDLEGRAGAFRRGMVDAVKAARATPTTPWIVEEMSFEGVPLDRVVNEALEVIDRLRHVSVEAIDGTFEALAELYPGASEEERRRLKTSVERLAKHQMDIWKARGPIVEQQLVAAITALDSDKRQALADLVVEVLRYVLQADLTGQSSTYNAFTLHMGAVVASEAYIAARSDALSILETLVLATDQIIPLRHILHAFQATGSTPDHGTLSADLLGAVLSDSLRIVRFMTAHAAKLPREIRQEYEHDLLWRYRHNGALPPDHMANKPLEAARIELQDAILAFRDAVNADKDFVIFKTLVGYQSVFAPAWEGDSFDINGEAAYRAEAINQLVGQVSKASFDRWLGIIGRCAASDAIGGGGSASLRIFLVRLGRSKPLLLKRLFDHLDGGLTLFLASMLQGLEGGPLEATASGRMRGWIAVGEHLSEIISYLEISKTLHPDLLASACHAAVAAEDVRAVAQAMGVSARRYTEAPQLMLAVFLDGLAYFADRKSGEWGDQVWFAVSRGEFIDHLDSTVRSRMLEGLVPLAEINFHAEELLRDIVAPSPTELLPFFRKRLTEDRDAASSRRFEAIPFEFHGLKEAFAPIPAETVAAVREWFDEEPDTALFEYHGGALIARAFPDLQPVLGSLSALVERTEEGDLEFVLRALMAYEGETVILPLCREIVVRLDADSPLLGMVDTVLDQSGVVSGEFGFVEQHQQRRAEIAPWLADLSPNVRAFAERRTRRFDLRIAADQRRSLEELELRKLHYGE